MGAFQINPAFSIPTGELTAQIVDNNGAPAGQVEAASDFQIRVQWNFATLNPGWLIPVRIRAFADELGGTFDGPLTSASVLPNFPNPGTANLTVTANTLPDPGQDSSVYKIVVVLAGDGAQFHDILHSTRRPSPCDSGHDDRRDTGTRDVMPMVPAKSSEIWHRDQRLVWHRDRRLEAAARHRPEGRAGSLS